MFLSNFYSFYIFSIFYDFKINHIFESIVLIDSLYPIKIHNCLYVFTSKSKKMVGSVPPINIVITICPTIQAYRPHTSPFLSFPYFSRAFTLWFSDTIGPWNLGQLRQYWRCCVGSLLYMCMCMHIYYYT